MNYIIDGRFIEIYFDDIPNERIRETLKICGWRWFASKKCWRNIKTEENIQWVQALKKEMTPKKVSYLQNLRRERITIVDLLVRSNSFYCNKHHDLEELAGEVEVVDKLNNICTYLIPIVYCRDCGVYYVLEETYRELKKHGRVRAEILTYTAHQHRGDSEWTELNEMSPMKAWGYTVSEEAGYTDSQRQSILEDIIDFNILSKSKVLSYLDFFIRLNQQKDNMALEKWKEDRKYIASYNIGSARRTRVGSVVVIDYIEK